MLREVLAGRSTEPFKEAVRLSRPRGLQHAAKACRVRPVGEANRSALSEWRWAVWARRGGVVRPARRHGKRRPRGEVWPVFEQFLADRSASSMRTSTVGPYQPTGAAARQVQARNVAHGHRLGRRPRSGRAMIEIAVPGVRNGLVSKRPRNISKDWEGSAVGSRSDQAARAAKNHDSCDARVPSHTSLHRSEACSTLSNKQHLGLEG